VLVGFVPNAPCGVERQGFTWSKTVKSRVPNAPCGVESNLALFSPSLTPPLFVPNAPCGVESRLHARRCGTKTWSS
jgi:hypothetical protein